MQFITLISNKNFLDISEHFIYVFDSSNIAPV